MLLIGFLIVLATITTAHSTPCSFFLSFQGYVYRDPACYTYSLNHAVLVVGYLIAGIDRDAPRLPPPFWIIRNSWGTDWGDGGYMRMGIEGGDGICGINVLPPLYPVVKSKHARSQNHVTMLHHIVTSHLHHGMV